MGPTILIMTTVIRIMIILFLFSCKNNKDNSGYQQNILYDALSRTITSYSTISDSVFIADRPSEAVTIISEKKLVMSKLRKGKFD